MDDDVVSRHEYEEYKQRVQDEEVRQNHRLEELEEQTKQINALTISVEKLAQSVKVMAETQESLGNKLEVIDGRDGEKWRKVVMYIVTTVIGIVLGIVFGKI